jgi:DNA-binding NarL/FixJ family response regulator
MPRLEDTGLPDAPPNDVTSRARSRAHDAGARVVLLLSKGETLGLALNALRHDGVVVERAHTLGDPCLKTRLHAVDVAFVDLEVSGVALDDLISEVRTAAPRAAIVVLASALPGERAAALLRAGIPSLLKPVSALALTELALELSQRPVDRRTMGPTLAPATGISLQSTIESYATHRALSRQQRVILRLYLNGANDKEIAGSCGCAQATIYEHWRRMGKKAGGSTKADAVTDFHRFLGTC